MPCLQWVTSFKDFWWQPTYHLDSSTLGYTGTTGNNLTAAPSFHWGDVESWSETPHAQTPRHPQMSRLLQDGQTPWLLRQVYYSQGQLHDWLSSGLLELFDCQFYNQKCLLMSTTASICKLKWQMLNFPLDCEWGLSSKYIPNPDTN